ncbi:hypothetical protein CSUB01_05546 [Colletotrichum sublineola]|uniref:Hemerythrin-like domain-containing protein n=1 Tax=Colletotrichum sublineola TaxID=1173701 RepID=A0A066XBI1_COLSU|nr:hypothetical protein CSUB01_05546 [Colletotrichum sublineola]
MSDSAAEEPQAEATAAPAQPELPPLTPAEFRVYNQMAEKMEYFVRNAPFPLALAPILPTMRPSRLLASLHGEHGRDLCNILEPGTRSTDTTPQHNYFRRQWTLLHDAATSGRRPRNMTLKQFLDTGLEFSRHLTAHHGIEEAHVFPMLAERMPEFRGGRAELLRQHKEIHKGLDAFEDYLRRCRDRETELELNVLREKMDGWGGVLWAHLDQEVATLGAENMRRYWTMEEVRRMPM